MYKRQLRDVTNASKTLAMGNAHVGDLDEIDIVLTLYGSSPSPLASLYDNIALFRIGLVMSDQPQNDIGPEHSTGQEDWVHYRHWLRPRDSRKLFQQFSAVCFFYAMHMTDLLKLENGETRRFGLIQVSLLQKYEDSHGFHF